MPFAVEVRLRVPTHYGGIEEVKAVREGAGPGPSAA